MWSSFLNLSFPFVCEFSDAFRTIMKEEEPIAFYKGIVPGLALVSYYSGFIFTKASVIDKRCYEWKG